MRIGAHIFVRRTLGLNFCAALALVSLFAIVKAHAAAAAVLPASPLPKVVPAPPVRQLSPATVKDLEPADQVIASPASDSLFILRGARLFELSLVKPFREKLIGEDESFRGQPLESAFTIEGRTYVLLNLGDKHQPLLYEVGGRRILPLAPKDERSNVRLAGFISEGFHVHQNGMLYWFTVSGKETPATAYSSWCWINLADGRVVKYPRWNFEHTDVAGHVVVFNYYRDGAEGKIWTPPFGIRVANGEAAYRLTDRLKNPYARTGSLQPRAVLRDYTYTRDNIIGVAVGRGSGYYRIPFPAEAHSVEKLEVSAAFAALHIRYSGDVDPEKYDADESLWVTPLRDGAPPRRAAYEVQDLAMLDGGYCLYSTRTQTQGWIRDEAYVYNYQRHETWRLLDGIATPIPPAERQFFVDTGAEARVTPAFGQRSLPPDGPGRGRQRLALAEVNQGHYDKRRLGPYSGRLPTQYKYNEKFLISSQGNRYRIELAKQPEDKVLLHRSGALVVQSERAAGAGGGGFNLKIFYFSLPKE